MAELVPLPYSRVRSTCYSDGLYDFSVTIPICYKDVYVNSFFPPTAILWNSMPIECSPLTYDLSSSKSRVKRHLLTVFLNGFPVFFNLYVLLFLVTECLVVAIQPYAEWIAIIKKYIFSVLQKLRKSLHFENPLFWDFLRILWEICDLKRYLDGSKAKT